MHLPAILTVCALLATSLGYSDDLPQALAAEPTIAALGASIDSKEGRFKVQLPAGFSETDMEVQPIQTEMGEIETVNYTSFSDTGATMVGTSEYPEALLVFIKGKEREVLEGAEEGALRNVSGTVVTEEEQTVSGFPARSVEFTAEADGQPLFGKALFILAENRLYHILFITSNRADINSDGITQFFQSFKIASSP